MTRNFLIDDRASFMQRFFIYLHYSINLLRFVFLSFFCSGLNFPGFIGKNFILKSSSRFKSGPYINIGDNVKIDAFVVDSIVFGRNCTIRDNVLISGMGSISQFGLGLSVGDFVGISERVVIFVRGRISIGSGTIIGPGVTIISENHIFHSIEIDTRLQGVNRAGICIGNNVWIGANATILDGVTIGQGAIIAAGSVVNKDVAPFCVAGGVPVRVFKSRN